MLLLHAADLLLDFGLSILLCLVVVLFVNVMAARATAGPVSVATPRVEASTARKGVLREPSLRQALTLCFAEATAGAAAIVVTVSYVRDVLNRGDTAFALVMAGLGLGSKLAALALGRATGRYEAGVVYFTRGRPSTSNSGGDS